MAKTKTNLLDLSTTGEIDRKTFTIDGTSYEIRNLDELSLSQQQRMAHAGKFFAKYFEKESNAVRDEKALKLLNDCLDLICVKLPAKIRDKLIDSQKFKVFHAFGEANNISAETKKK